MLPSRGLRPHQVVPLASRHSSIVRSGASRKFSSITRKSAISAPSCRTSPLRSSSWRTGTTSPLNVHLSASSVRYGSWYAPWSWGRSSPPPDASPPATTPSELATEPTPLANSVVTTATPELAPAGIDKPAVVEGTSSADPKTVEELLGLDPTPPVDTTAIVDPTTLVSYWGNLKDLGLDYGWGTSSFFENMMELTYLNSALGWSGSIVASAILLRVILFFGFQIRGSDAMAKMAAMKPALQPLMDKMEAAKRVGDSEKVTQYQMEQRRIMKDVGAGLSKTLGTPLAQMVFGFGAFRCLRGMTSLPVPGMTTDGLAWFTDLTVSDPLYILPMVTGGLMYVIIRMGGETGMAADTQQAGFQKQVQVIMPIVMTAVTAFQPAAIQLYFLSSAVLGGTTAYTLRQSWFRTLFRLRQLPTPESNELYSKVIKGEVKLDAIRGADGKVRYQAPNTRSSSKPSSDRSKPSTSTSRSAINLKSGTVLPPHMRKTTAKIDSKYADRDVDFETGMPKGYSNIGEKWSWLRRNYSPRFVGKRVSNWLTRDQRDVSVRIEQQRRETAKAAARKYEIDRKRRLEGR